jgi:hypothetical protein
MFVNLTEFEIFMMTLQYTTCHLKVKHGLEMLVDVSSYSTYLAW